MQHHLPVEYIFEVVPSFTVSTLFLIYADNPAIPEKKIYLKEILEKCTVNSNYYW